MGRTSLILSPVYHVLNLLQPWVLDEEPSIEIMKAAWDLGINTIDTANIYSNGESERLIAKFIKKVCLIDVLNLSCLDV
jgi:aryl-alcohol dehydrogenase-like predicted oxidoreductase